MTESCLRKLPKTVCDKPVKGLCWCPGPCCLNNPHILAGAVVLLETSALLEERFVCWFWLCKVLLTSGSVAVAPSGYSFVPLDASQWALAGRSRKVQIFEVAWSLRLYLGVKICFFLCFTVWTWALKPFAYKLDTRSGLGGRVGLVIDRSLSLEMKKA